MTKVSNVIFERNADGEATLAGLGLGDHITWVYGKRRVVMVVRRVCPLVLAVS